MCQQHLCLQEEPVGHRPSSSSSSRVPVPHRLRLCLPGTASSWRHGTQRYRGARRQSGQLKKLLPTYGRSGSSLWLHSSGRARRCRRCVRRSSSSRRSCSGAAERAAAMAEADYGGAHLTPCMLLQPVSTHVGLALVGSSTVSGSEGSRAVRISWLVCCCNQKDAHRDGGAVTQCMRCLGVRVTGE